MARYRVSEGLRVGGKPLDKTEVLVTLELNQEAKKYRVSCVGLVSYPTEPRRLQGKQLTLQYLPCSSSIG